MWLADRSWEGLILAGEAPPRISEVDPEIHETRADGVQARAAALLGIRPRQLGHRLRTHGIVRAFQVAGGSVSSLDA